MAEDAAENPARIYWERRQRPSVSGLPSFSQLQDATQAILAVVITIAVLGYLFDHGQIPPDLETVWIAVIGFYFGKQSGVAGVTAGVSAALAANNHNGNGYGNAPPTGGARG